MTVRACRAYFELTDDVPETAGNAPSIVIDYGDDATAIDNVLTPEGIGEQSPWQRSTFNVQRGAGWYTLDGHKLDGKPTKKGVYIYNGRKVVR